MQVKQILRSLQKQQGQLLGLNQQYAPLKKLQII